MPRSSGRGQTEPLAALVAVVAVCLGFGLYVGVLNAERPGATDRRLAESAVDRVDAVVAPTGVAAPSRVSRGPAAGPPGYRTNVTLVVDGTRWSAGPAVPANADRANRRLGVRTALGRVRPGTLEVCVWR